MAIWRKSLLLISCALISAPGIAQQSEREAKRAVEEQQLTVEVQMREAEERLAEAARQIAELSTSNLPAVVEIERRIHMEGRHPFPSGSESKPWMRRSRVSRIPYRVWPVSAPRSGHLHTTPAPL